MGRAFRVASFFARDKFRFGRQGLFRPFRAGARLELKAQFAGSSLFSVPWKTDSPPPRTMRTRIRLADGTRPGFEVTDAARAEALRSLAQALESAGVDAPRVTRILRDAAPATPAEFARFEALAAELSKGKARPKPTRNDLTFRTARAPLDVW